jgi:ABC-type bacteriocin/lantibiotic exporter with double-glycine peptidase domain
LKYQRFDGSCGANAIVNALRCLGRKVDEVKVRKLAGATEGGCDEDGLTYALECLGYQTPAGRILDCDFWPTSWDWLGHELWEGNPCILCIDRWQHWVVAVGMLGSKVILADGNNTKPNMSENGVHVLTARQLRNRWFSHGSYYGIAVKKQ